MCLAFLLGILEKFSYVYVLDTIGWFHTTISAAIKVRMVIVRSLGAKLACDDVSTGKCIPNSKQSS